MTTLGPEIAEKVLAACQQNAGDIAGSLGTNLDGSFEVGEIAPVPLDPAALPAELAGAALVLAMHVEDQAALAVLCASTGFLPDWYAEPDATGESKLSTLAQELSMQVLPDDFFCEVFHAGKVADIAAGLTAAEVTAGASAVAIELKRDALTASLYVIWPAAKPGVLFAADDAVAANETPAAAAPSPAAGPAPEVGRPAASPVRGGGYQSFEEGLEHLPPFVRSLLQINVPVAVTLATTKQKVRQILELGPGTIIQFDKSCEETLELEIRGQRIAVGEAVKVGDKFGLRVTSIILPEERFEALGRRPGPQRRTG